MNPRAFIAVILSAALLCSTAFAAPVSDRLIGKVTVRNSAKLDAQAKKELAVIANKIKKSRGKGAVIIIGDVASAQSQDEYILNAVFTARAVESHLKSLLSGSHDVFIAAAKYGGEKKTGRNSVEIRLYPHELKVMEGGVITFQPSSAVLHGASVPVFDQPIRSDVPSTAQPGMLTPPPADDERGEVTSKKERLKEHIEDPVLANELVIRAKARAAARARQLEQRK